MCSARVIFFVASLLVSLQSVSSIIVPAYNSNYCPNIDFLVEVIDNSNDGSHVLETYRLMNYVQAWESSFKSSGDFLLRVHNEPLCIGLLNDAGAPNAIAIGTMFILIGQDLLHNIYLKSIANNNLKIITEKFVLAHEYAHFIQNIYGLKFEYLLPLLSTKIKEQHADCMASYILKINNEMQESLSDDLKIFIGELADAHIVGDHGTAAQRLSAYTAGASLGSVRLSNGHTRVSTTSKDIIKQCGMFYVPTNLNEI